MDFILPTKRCYFSQNISLVQKNMKKKQQNYAQKGIFISKKSWVAERCMFCQGSSMLKKRNLLKRYKKIYVKK